MKNATISCLMLLITTTAARSDESWFDGRRDASEVSAAVRKAMTLADYPDLFQIRLWPSNDFRAPVTVVGKWRDLDRNGAATYPQAAVKVEIASVSPGELAWRIAVQPAIGFGVFSVKFPILAVPKSDDAAERLLVPQQYGRAIERPSLLKDYSDGELPRLKKAIWFGPYGGQRQSMQMMIYALSQRSLMLWTQDSEGYAKDFVVSESEVQGPLAGQAMLFYLYHFPSQTGQAGTAWTSPYPTVTSTFAGNYYAAAKRYRQWAIQQPWCRRGTLPERLASGDLPAWFASNTLWATAINHQNLPVLERFAAAFPDTEIGVFLTQWMRWGFDVNAPEYFPPNHEEGYEKLLAARSHRLHMIPYMNMHLVDGDFPWAVATFTSGRALALPERAMVTDGAECRDYVERWGEFKNPDGSVRRRMMYPMCRSSKLWQNYFTGLVNSNLQYYGADGQYFDQLGVLPYPCWDPTHGHPLGFGPHLLQGGRQMLERARRENPGKLVFAEHLQEFYIGAADECYAIWPAYYQEKIVIVPLFPLVYQEYLSQHEWNIPPPALKRPEDFAHALALSTHLGHKPGSFVMYETIPGLLQSEHQASLRFLQQVEALLRMSQSVYGEKLADPEVAGSYRHTVALWESGTKSRSVSVPAATASAWKLPGSGQVALLLINAGKQEAKVGLISEYMQKQAALLDLMTKETLAWKPGTPITLLPLSARILVVGTATR